MSLPQNQIKFIEENYKGKSKEEIQDMVAFFTKQNKKKYYKKYQTKKNEIGNIMFKVINDIKAGDLT